MDVAAPAQETITLYLDLEPGDRADFEVVGRVSAAFAETVREIAYVLEPGLEFSLEFESGIEGGSLHLNAIFKEAKGKAKRGVAIAIIVTVAGWFVKDLRTYGVSKFLDTYLAPDQRQQLSDADVDRIANALKNVIDQRIAKDKAQQVYQELRRDKKITRVGTAPAPNATPIDPVPRDEFPNRAGMIQPVETTPKTRTRKSVEKLTLISPVLLPTDRIWRFHSPFGEFGYIIRDEKFLKGLLSGKRRIPMREGIQITAKIETHEEQQDGVWVVVARFIDEVVRVHRGKVQSDLFAPPKKRKSHKR